MADKFKRHVKEAISWVAAQSKFMKNTKIDLEELKRDIQTAKKKKELKDVHKALKDFWFVSSSENRVLRYEVRVYEALEEMKKNYKITHSGNLNELEELQARIITEARAILNETAERQGRIRAGLINLEKLITGKGKQKEAMVQLQKVSKEVDATLAWMYRLIGDLEKTKKAGKLYARFIRLGRPALANKKI